MPAPTPAAPSAPVRQDASMLLLTNLMKHALDDGYAEAAARRGGKEPVRRPGWLLLVGLLAAGLLLSTAAVQTRDRASSAAEARTALVGEIESRESANDRVEDALESQRDQVAAARQRTLRLTAEGKTLASSLSTLEVATGAGAVTGPALVIHVEDAAPNDADGADVDPRTDLSTDGRITDRDLQTIVNEVWASGAEAVAVNGQRLTTLSAIRSAGDAVLVDFRPLSPPYDVVGVGDDEAMRTAFAEGFGGSYLQALHDYGISYSMDTKDRVRLAASAGVMLRYATAPAETENSS